MTVALAPFTAHARLRQRQRGIPTFVIDLLEEVGSGFRCQGAERLIFDKAALRRMRRRPNGSSEFRGVERWLGVYAVVGDNGLVLTVAHRRRRIRRP